jgi:hypothetical protein
LGAKGFGTVIGGAVSVMVPPFCAKYTQSYLECRVAAARAFAGAADGGQQDPDYAPASASGKDATRSS